MSGRCLWGVTGPLLRGLLPVLFRSLWRFCLIAIAIDGVIVGVIIFIKFLVMASSII